MYFGLAIALFIIATAFFIASMITLYASEKKSKDEAEMFKIAYKAKIGELTDFRTRFDNLTAKHRKLKKEHSFQKQTIESFTEDTSFAKT